MNTQTSLFSLPLDTTSSLQSSKLTTKKMPQHYEEQAKTSDAISVLLNTLFPEQLHQDKEIKQAKVILSGLSTVLTGEEIQVMIYEIQHLEIGRAHV